MGTIPERISAREYEMTMKESALLACSKKAKKLAEGLYEYAIDPEANVEVFLSLLQRSFK